MIYRIFIGSFAIFVSMLLCSCLKGGEYVEIHSAKSAERVMTTADVRAIHQIEVKNGINEGRIIPEYIICAEPSPDIAKAVADALNLSASADFKGLASVDPKLAAAVSKARTEGVAQLTERLATIQLLRDTLYRACEAYANGAISASSYTVMLSRYDDIMITMLLGEFAAGAFGRPLATVALEVNDKTSSPLTAGGQSGNGNNKEKKLKDKLKDLQNRLKTAKEKNDTSEIKDIEKQISTTEQEIADLESKVENPSMTALVTGAGGITHAHDSEIANTLAQMQRKYLENLNSDALEVTCIETLFENKAAKPELKTFCSNYLTKSCEFKKEILRGIMTRSQQERMQVENKQRITNSVNEIKEYIEVMKNLIEKTKDLESGENDAGGSH